MKKKDFIFLQEKIDINQVIEESYFLLIKLFISIKIVYVKKNFMSDASLHSDEELLMNQLHETSFTREPVITPKNDEKISFEKEYYSQKKVRKGNKKKRMKKRKISKAIERLSRPAPKFDSPPVQSEKRFVTDPQLFDRLFQQSLDKEEKIQKMQEEHKKSDEIVHPIPTCKESINQANKKYREFILEKFQDKLIMTGNELSEVLNSLGITYPKEKKNLNPIFAKGIELYIVKEPFSDIIQEQEEEDIENFEKTEKEDCKYVVNPNYKYHAKDLMEMILESFNSKNPSRIQKLIKQKIIIEYSNSIKHTKEKPIEEKEVPHSILTKETFARLTAIRKEEITKRKPTEKDPRHIRPFSLVPLSRSQESALKLSVSKLDSSVEKKPTKPLNAEEIEEREKLYMQKKFEKINKIKDQISKSRP